MSDSMLRILIAMIVVTFVAVCLGFTRPVSPGGRFSLKLALVNAAGWLIVLPLSDAGHPPPWLIGLAIFWLMNLVLLPAAMIALWVSYKGREERTNYLAVAGTYLCLNLIFLFLVPVVSMFHAV